MKPFISLLLFISTITVFGQTFEEKLAERALNKVDLYTSKENDNLQIFYAEQVKKMKLSDEVTEEYYMSLTYYTNKMGRLGAKDKNYSDSEMKTKFDGLVAELNTEMHEVLTDDQFQIHKETFNKIIESVYTRKGWKK